MDVDEELEVAQETWAILSFWWPPARFMLPIPYPVYQHVKEEARLRIERRRRFRLSPRAFANLLRPKSRSTP